MVISVYSGAFLQKPVAYLAQFLLFCANDLTRTLFVVKAATMSHRILHMQIKLTGILCVEPKWFLSSPYFRFNPPIKPNGNFLHFSVVQNKQEAMLHVEPYWS